MLFARQLRAQIRFPLGTLLLRLVLLRELLGLAVSALAAAARSASALAATARSASAFSAASRSAFSTAARFS
jgi:hypothetical protein